MRFRYWQWVGYGLGLVLLGLAGCQSSRGEGGEEVKLPPEVEELGPTIASRGRVYFSNAISVEGYGLVAGLAGTGSESCPPQVLDYLRRFVSSEVPDHRINVDRLVKSKATAVVYLEGVVPRAAKRGDRFDVKLTELSGRPHVSLAGGWLYAADLWPKGRGPSTRLLARVKGASSVFYDSLAKQGGSQPTPYVLGGGYVVTPSPTSLNLPRPDFRVITALRNQINAHFSSQTADAQSGSSLLLTVPSRYSRQPERFYGVVESLYLEQNQLLLAQRVEVLGKALQANPTQLALALRLEGLGPTVQPKLKLLLEDKNEDVRLAVAHCLLNLGSAYGLSALVELAASGDPSRQRAAVQALLAAGGFLDIRAILQDLLNRADSETAQVVFDEVSQVLDARLTASPLPGEEIPGGAVLHLLPHAPYSMVAVSRRMGARVGIFGEVRCLPNSTLTSPDGRVTVDTRAGQRYALVTRRLPGDAGVIGPLACSFQLADVIRRLCAKPDSVDLNRGGCGLPYVELLPLLRQMCVQGMVDAGFHAGPVSEIAQ